MQALSSSKIDIEEALNIGINIEPRALEVLPAAVPSFPKSFLHLEKAPPEFMQVIAALRRGKIGPDFQGIEFKKFFEAAKRTTSPAPCPN